MVRAPEERERRHTKIVMQTDQQTKLSSLTLPQAYRLGLNRTLPRPVVIRFTLGGTRGYCGGQYTSNSNSPLSYGVPVGAAIIAFGGGGGWTAGEASGVDGFIRSSSGNECSGTPFARGICGCNRGKPADTAHNISVSVCRTQGSGDNSARGDNSAPVSRHSRWGPSLFAGGCISHGSRRPPSNLSCKPLIHLEEMRAFLVHPYGDAAPPVQRELPG